VNLPESLLSSGTPDLAALAAKSAVLRRAASLAGWAGGGKRALTAKGVLRKQDVPAAAAIIGVKAPQAVRSAADLPELHLAWCAAVGMGLLTVEGGKASGGPELKNWPPDDGTRLLEAWLRGFFAVSAGRPAEGRAQVREAASLAQRAASAHGGARRPARGDPGPVRLGRGSLARVPRGRRPLQRPVLRAGRDRGRRGRPAPRRLPPGAGRRSRMCTTSVPTGSTRSPGRS
jgi:hypothetical protein